MKGLMPAPLGVLLLGLVACGWVAWDFWQPVQHAQPFSSIGWVAAPLVDQSNDPGCFRGGMALDLIERRLLIGKTATEVVSLLRSPSSSPSGYWAYDLGQCAAWGWSDSALKLRFNNEAKVIAASFY